VIAVILFSALIVTESASRSEVPVEILLLDAHGRPRAEALIVLDDGELHPAPAEARFEIEQRGLAFRPSLAAVQVGAEVFFPNRDPFAHHIYSFSPGMRFELPLHRSGERPSHRFSQPGVAVIGCNIHDRMQATLVVAPGPWFGFTDADGRLRLQVPPGRYRVLGFSSEEAALKPLGDGIAKPEAPSSWVFSTEGLKEAP
jgi:plastocyanin